MLKSKATHFSFSPMFSRFSVLVSRHFFKSNGGSAPCISSALPLHQLDTESLDISLEHHRTSSWLVLRRRGPLVSHQGIDGRVLRVVWAASVLVSHAVVFPGSRACLPGVLPLPSNFIIHITMEEPGIALDLATQGKHSTQQKQVLLRAEE